MSRTRSVGPFGASSLGNNAVLRSACVRPPRWASEIDRDEQKSDDGEAANHRTLSVERQAARDKEMYGAFAPVKSRFASRKYPE